MPHFLVTRRVISDQIVLVEAENEREAEEKGQAPSSGEVQYQDTIGVEEVARVEGDADY